MMQYHEQPFTLNDLSEDPIAQFALWYHQAESQGESDPSAMTLATVNHQYHVTARMLLLKSFDQNGFTFFTNYKSQKADDLAEVPNAAMVFWWPLCQRQVRITGKVTKSNEHDSDRYFAQRNRGSQIAAIVSKQSAVIPDREDLLTRFHHLTQKLENQPQIQRPDYWGGFLLAPETIEFWQGRTHRLHDRFLYQKISGSWHIDQLSP